MIDFRDIFIKTFLALADDDVLIQLLKIDLSDITDPNKRMGLLRESIIESSSPDEIRTKYNSRICIHEDKGSWTPNRQTTHYLAVDVHITKENNLEDRRGVQILKRIIEILDTEERKSQGKKPLNIGLIGLQYKSDSLDQSSKNTGWEKFSVIFEYRYFKK